MNNCEIVTLAVYLLGGDTSPIDAEDIAVKANEIAPGRFTWRKYKDQISIDNVRKRLWDAKSEEHGSYLIGSDKQGWQLTEMGLKFSKNQVKDLSDKKLARKPIDQKEQVRLRMEKERMLSSKAFIKYQNNAISEISLNEANAFFRIDEYVPKNLKEGKIVRAINNFGDDSELGVLVKELAEIVRRS